VREAASEGAYSGAVKADAPRPFLCGADSYRRLQQRRTRRRGGACESPAVADQRIAQAPTD